MTILVVSAAPARRAEYFARLTGPMLEALSRAISQCEASSRPDVYESGRAAVEVQLRYLNAVAMQLREVEGEPVFPDFFPALYPLLRWTLDNLWNEPSIFQVPSFTSNSEPL